MANTNKGRKFYIAVTAPGGSVPIAKSSDLTKEQYEALNWTQVGNVGAVGESGTQTNLPSYDELDTDVSQKQKGMSNAGDPTIECARNPTDLGQIAMRAAAATKFNYAFKTEDNDAPDANSSNSIYYNRGVVTGPTRPNGRNEDFILEVFTLGLNQTEIVVNPSATVAPTNTQKPAIAGSEVRTGVVLTALPGVWTGNPVFTYQWQADDAGNGVFADIVGATSETFTPVVGNVGDSLRLEVTGTTTGGNATANSLPTAAQVAA